MHVGKAPSPASKGLMVVSNHPFSMGNIMFSIHCSGAQALDLEVISAVRNCVHKGSGTKTGVPNEGVTVVVLIPQHAQVRAFLTRAWLLIHRVAQYASRGERPLLPSCKLAGRLRRKTVQHSRQGPCGA